MEQKVKKYCIVLENCEHIDLEKEDLIDAVFVEVNKTIEIYKNLEEYHKKNSLFAKEVLLTLDIDKLKSRQTSFSENEYNAYERLIRHSDVVAFEIVYEDDSKEIIYVPFDGEDENKAQETIHETILEKACLKLYFKEEEK